MLNFNIYSILCPFSYYLGVGYSDLINTVYVGGAASSPFPFFRLPPEIRNQVYSILFVSRHNGHLKTLLPRYQSERKFGQQFTVAMSDGLALLRSCQQAHEEATAILYGWNIFHFDEEYCIDEDEVKFYHETPCLNVRLTGGDTAFLFEFLVGIGGRNRAKIRHLRLSFEPTDLNENMYGDCNSLHLALYLFCEGLNLATLELVFKSQYFSEVFNDLFSPSHLLISKLQQFRGIKELRILKSGSTFIPAEVSRPQNSTYVQTRALMESGHTDEQRTLNLRAALANIWNSNRAIQSSSLIYELANPTRYGFQNEPANQLQGIRQATLAQVLLAAAQRWTTRAGD